MTGEDRLTMSQKDLKRLHIIHRVLDRTLTQIEASGVLDLSDRQVRRIVMRVREEGDKGILHQSLGQPSHNAIDPKIRERALTLYRDKYPDFGPTFASEKLSENHKIRVSDETLRSWLIQESVPYRTRKKHPHRQWRERKPCLGQMLQLDGSHHDWLEGRGPKLVLMAYIDDATGKVSARFYDYEGTLPALDSFKRYIQRYGLPQSVYLDKHTTYKSTAKPDLEDELKDHKPLSQFERALGELGVEVIHAHSPQAKGRVERLFRTFQDRLIKELRLKSISTKNDANLFLGTYLPSYNKRFQVEPSNDTDLHRPIPKDLDLGSVLSIRRERTLRNDSTLSHKGKLYRIKTPLRAKSLRVEERLNGQLHVFCENTRVPFEEILTRPVKAVLISTKPKRTAHRPLPDHPWRDSYKDLKVQRQNRTF